MDHSAERSTRFPARRVQKEFEASNAVNHRVGDRRRSCCCLIEEKEKRKEPTLEPRCQAAKRSKYRALSFSRQLFRSSLVRGLGAWMDTTSVFPIAVRAKAARCPPTRQVPRRCDAHLWVRGQVGFVSVWVRKEKVASAHVGRGNRYPLSLSCRDLPQYHGEKIRINLMIGPNITYTSFARTVLKLPAKDAALAASNQCSMAHNIQAWTDLSRLPARAGTILAVIPRSGPSRSSVRVRGMLPFRTCNLHRRSPVSSMLGITTFNLDAAPPDQLSRTCFPLRHEERSRALFANLKK